MTKKIIAITQKDSTYIFNKRSMIAVPERSAQKIADILTLNNYKLAPGQIWYVYDNDFYLDDFIDSEIRSYRRGCKKIKLYPYYGG